MTKPVVSGEANLFDPQLEDLAAYLARAKWHARQALPELLDPEAASAGVLAVLQKLEELYIVMPPQTLKI